MTNSSTAGGGSDKEGGIPHAESPGTNLVADPTGGIPHAETTATEETPETK
jgi:hypothetical protein